MGPMLVLAAAAAVLWCALLVVPWRPWRGQPALEPDPAVGTEPVADVTALIPARNESRVLAQCLAAVQAQVSRVVVVDDQSTDDTAAIATGAGASVVHGEALPAAWSGKVWALEQGRGHVETDYVLLLDADIELKAGIVPTLLAKMKREEIAFASLVPRPGVERFWEKLLMPAFVWFFALLYPFALSNSP